MSRPGRDFEVLVSRIEQWLTPKAAVVKSPDYLTDCDTGQQREVDASIRLQVGSAPVLITIECRHRSSKEDVRWIEELACKRESIGAAKTVAVSSTGFSHPAVKKAERLGIEVRRIHDITEDTVAQWAHNVRIHFHAIRWRLLQVDIQAGSGSVSPEARLPNEVAESFQRDPNGTQIGYERSTRKPLTVKAVLDQALRAGGGIADDVEPGADPIRKTISLKFPEGTFCVFTDRGEVDVRELRVTLDLWMTVERPTPITVWRYESPMAEVMQVAESSLSVDGQERFRLLLSQKPPGDTDETCGA